MPQDDDEILWPHGVQKSNPNKLLEAVKEIADVATEKQIKELARAESEIKKLQAIANSNGDLGTLQDMPETVLDGRLGELCERFMLTGKRFPVAYAWPALLAVASVFTPRHGPKQRLNLFCGIVGPVHSGKSQAIYAAQQLLGLEAPALMNMMAGSAEGLARRCKDAAGNARLFSPDELGHLLEKAGIQNASFASVLSRAFYESKFELHMGKKEVAEFNCSLSILGGLVDKRFDDLFSQATTAGLYDRFLFGCCPDAFKFDYFPFEAEARAFDLASVFVHQDVWTEKSVWCMEDRELEPRVVEIAIRAAITCASFDGKTLLTAKDLAPAYEFAQYQKRIRRLLKPNEGENIEGKVTLKLVAKLKQYGGKYITRRKLLNDIGAHRYGLSVADRALAIMHANGEIEITKKERPVKIRLLLEDEGEQE